MNIHLVRNFPSPENRIMRGPGEFGFWSPTDAMKQTKGRGEWGPVAYCPKSAPAVCGIKTRIDGLIDNSGSRGRNKILKSMMLVHQVPDASGDSAGLTQIQLKCCNM